MPLYQYKCKECGLQQDEIRTINRRNNKGACSSCGADTQRELTGSRVEVFRPITLEHIATTPMTFHSKSQLRKYCRSHGLESGALL